MARIPQEELERLKRDVDLAELVKGADIELKRKGDSLLGLCPFHDDKEPSLVVTPSKNLWNCLGACGTGGSVIDWVMKAEGVSFRHAVEILRNGHQVTVTPSRAKRIRARKLPCPVEGIAEDGELLAQVVDYYHETLLESPEAIAYLESRGIRDDEAITTFKLGFANRTLGLRLQPGYRADGAELRGRLTELGVYRTTGHEHLNGSLTIPVFDAQGHVIELYGRKISNKLRPGTAFHLYLPGPHRGVFNLAALRESKEIILCESLIDALTFWCAGFRNVTSSFGTNGFTTEMLEAMKACGTERVLIAYDRDDAGNSAAAKLADKLGEEGISCFRVLFPRNMDANAYGLKVQPATRALATLLRSAEHLAGPITTRIPPNRPATPPREKPMNTSVITEAEPSPQLVAASESQPEVITQEITASPIPEPPKPDLEAEVSETEIIIHLSGRRWRIRGLNRNTSYEHLRINLLVAAGDRYHVDNLDLYSARHRVAFLKQSAAELGVKPELLKKDLGQVLLKLEQLQAELIEKATKPVDAKPTMSEAERREALALLEDSNLLDRVVADLERCGVVGEETNKLVGFLAAVSRKLAEPLALLIQSSSAAGKSALMNSILALLPEEERVHYSAMTGQSLFYMGEADLRHKVLAIAEEEGAEKASYALKLLQSEGELTIASTGKDPTSGRLVTHEYRVEGPVAIVLTTTAIDIDEELMNRCLVLSVDEDRQQTRAIHRLQRERRTLGGLKTRHERQSILSLHQNAQRLLEPIAVVNPFATHLTFLDTQTRTRRDHEKYLSLIESIALLRQKQRKVKTFHDGRQAVPYIEVTLEDISLANRLAAEVLGRTLDELPPQTRRFLELLWQLVNEQCERLGLTQSEVRFTRREVLDATGLSYPQVRRHIYRLLQLEYVLAHRGGRGASFVYELLWNGKGLDGSRFLMGLIDPELLASTTESLTPSGETLTPGKAKNDPSLTPHLPPLDPPLPPKEKARKSNQQRRFQKSGAESGENALIGAKEKDLSYVAAGRSR
ncbi:MAG: toprim domain-containing protein [bacterium]|nr:toprim domain-containing protein [bacterium]